MVDLIGKSVPVGMTTRVLRSLPPSTPAADAVAFLRRNKFPLLSLAADDCPRWLVDAPEFQKALAADREEWALQRSEFERVHAAWTAAGIGCMFIKTACVPPSFPYTSDNLDIMVRAEHGKAAKEILRQLGFVELVHIEEENKFLFRKFQNGRSVCAVHLHYWVGWDLNFFEQDLLWQRARTAPDDPLVTAPSPEDALLINLAHAFFENKTFTLHDLEKVRAAWQQHEPDWDYLPQMPARCGWHDGFLLSALVAADLEEAVLGETGVPARTRGQWWQELRRYPLAWRYYERLLRQPKTFPFKVNFAFSKLLYYRKIQRDRRDTPIQKVRNTVRTLAWGFKQKSGIRPRPGMVIAFSGVDGSGKTTHIQQLSRVLETSEIRPVHYWNRVGCSPLTRLVSRLTSRFTSKANRQATAAEAANGPDKVSDNPVVQAGWAWLMTADLLARYTVRVRLPLLLGKLGLGRVVVCDRYAMDAEAEISLRTEGRNRGVRAALWTLRALSPKAHVSYLLDVPVEVAQARHELPIAADEIEAYRQAYRQANTKYGAKVVDGERPLAETGDAIAAEVLNAFARRYPTPLNALLLSNPRQLNPRLDEGAR